MAHLVAGCPSCGGTLEVRRLWCPRCEIALAGSFELGVLAGLSPEQQQFVIEFVKAGGSLKQMAARFRVSYPTVRNRLDELIQEIERLEAQSEPDERGDGPQLPARR